MRRRLTTSPTLLGPLVVVVVVSMFGCYERVVEVRGPGARKMEVYEPNLDKNEHIPVVDDFGNALDPPEEEKPPWKR